MEGTIIGTIKKLVRAAAILTGTYVAGTVIETKPGANQLIIEAGFTKGSLTTAEIKVEFSEDNTTFYQETAKSTTGGTETDTLVEHAIGATGNYRLAIPIMDRYIKISAKGTGTATDSSLSVDAKIGTI